MKNRYQAVETFTINSKEYSYFPFNEVGKYFALDRLPFSIKILLENLLRHCHEDFVDESHIEAVAGWDSQKEPDTEIAFVPSRVILQDFTGVPAIVDLATMRDAMASLGGDPDLINPLSPAELVIDHSVMVDFFGHRDSLQRNTDLEVERNKERYQFLKWGQQSFNNLKVVPPGTGIVHQVNLEYLARTVFSAEKNGRLLAYPDTLVGTDSHTTMINGLGVLGWGVGGIEAEAAMLGQPISMLIPQVVGFRITGKMAEGATATDLVLTVTQMLRKRGVVGKFVEFFGSGLKHLSVADRATIANMAPEYGATCGLFHIDEETLNYLRFTGRDNHQIEFCETYLKRMGFWHEDGKAPEAEYSSTLHLNLADVVPCIAGPKRPQDRIPLDQAKTAFLHSLHETIKVRESRQQTAEAGFEDEGGDTAIGQLPAEGAVEARYNGQRFTLEDGDVVIAAITSCTNTSNPEILITAGLLARNAVSRGLTTKPWVKTSLAPGSKVVTDYLEKSGLMRDLEKLGFFLVGYGCTTCIGNSGPLPNEIEQAIDEGNLTVSSVLSGNRNFEGRIHGKVRNNYLASPPLVVAYALAGTMAADISKDPLGNDSDGNSVYLADLWPSSEEIKQVIGENLNSEMFTNKYADVYTGPASWRSLNVDGDALYSWPDSSYIKKAPFFDGITATPPPLTAITRARCLVKVGDSITTDHISPAGAIDIHSPAGEYLQSLGIPPKDFNSYGSRRGNHEVMMRGTFANVRLKNSLAPETEGSWTCHYPSETIMSIFAAAEQYRREQVPLIVLAGKEYGTGSSRDWAAKGPALLGVKAIIAESYERIHRSNLVGMGILPLQFKDGESAETLNLCGNEIFTIELINPQKTQLAVTAENPQTGEILCFSVKVRIDTANEFKYYHNGGILHYVLRKLAEKS
ncbi:MAG: aconitate hydratase AcnA [Porticoccaceae bacterium]|nr:aconitate hydratase AcnA [Porticoccaceae bacterium]